MPSLIDKVIGEPIPSGEEVVVPISGWNTLAEKAIRFALPIFENIFMTHINTDEEGGGQALR